MKTKITLILLSVFFIASCCKGPVEVVGDSFLHVEIKEWPFPEEGSWWVYKMTTISNNNDTTERILDTVFLIEKNFFYDTIWSNGYDKLFCSYESEMYLHEHVQLVFQRKETPIKIGVSDGSVNYYSTGYYGELFLYDYFSETGNLFDQGIIMRLEYHEFIHYPEISDLNITQTLEVEGIEYNNVYTNSLYSIPLYSTQEYYEDEQNPKVWFTKNDWIIKVEYNSTIFTLVDKNIIKN